VDTVRAPWPKSAKPDATNLIQKYSYSADEFLRRVRRGPVPAARQPQRSSSTASFGRAAIRRGADANPLLGQKVRHPQYGVGTIIGVEGDDDDRRLSVAFPGRGTKKIRRTLRANSSKSNTRFLFPGLYRTGRKASDFRTGI